MNSGVRITTRLVIIVFLVVFFLWFITIPLTFYLLPDWQNRGIFGEIFGSVNSLFSGFAFAGLIFTILLQSQELKLQREEMRGTRIVLSDQKEQMEKQNRNIDLQKKENFLFNMINLYETKSSNLNYDEKPGDPFKNILRVIHNTYYPDKTDQYEHFLNLMENANNNIFITIKPIFSLALTICNFINASFDDQKVKILYSSVFRSTLEETEHIIMYYYFASDPDPKEYNMLKDLNMFESLPDYLAIDGENVPK